MQRGFKVVTKYENSDIQLPYRATEQAAGYDFASADDMVLPSIWKLNFLKVLWAIKHGQGVDDDQSVAAQKILKPYLIPTGIKAYMQDNEVLIIANRSSNPLKRGLYLPNGIGVIDADYYDNPNNEGEIFVQMINFGLTDYHIKKGERIAQGIFMPFLAADDSGQPKSKKRIGGFGSSGK
ncbi:dCTP deaminase/dUTPase family protein [Lactobacillaceae bacterium Melli_B4]